MTVTEQQLLQIVTASLGRPARPSDTWADLGVDSLGMAEMMTEVERTFDVRLDERVFEVESIAEMAQLLDSERAAAAAK
jgi:acyl carrier protein